MDECNEIADAMLVRPGMRYAECEAAVKAAMPDETFTVRANVADALYDRSEQAARALGWTKVYLNNGFGPAKWIGA